MNPPERVVSFACGAEQLVGILTQPAQGAVAGRARVLIVVGGPQYRAGAHRMFVKLARELAQAGHEAMRFDVRGMGDSSGAQRSFEDLSADIAAAIDAFDAQAQTQGPLVLFGLCDAASANLLYLADTRDRRVHALALLNPWARSQATLARTHVRHYYVRRLLSREFWSKVGSGGVGLGALTELARNLWLSSRSHSNVPKAPARRIPGDGTYIRWMLKGWQSFEGRTLLALSDKDLTAQEFSGLLASDREWASQAQGGTVGRVELVNADHTLSTGPAFARFAQELTRFLGSLLPKPEQRA